MYRRSRSRSLSIVVTTLCLFLFGALQGNDARALDLSKAQIVAPRSLTLHEKRAVQLLVDQVEKHTLIRLPVRATWPASGPAIGVGPAGAVEGFAGPYASLITDAPAFDEAEGYRIRTGNTGGVPAVLIVGNDARGVLFGIGRLLRELRMGHGRLEIPSDFSVTTAPHTGRRGHQLGFRPKTNSYDGWDFPVWKQYVEDLIVFGMNAVELIPPRSDDAADSPHFPRPQIDIMKSMSQLLDDYGLEVWVWYPALDEDYSDAATVDAALQEWGEVFRQLPRIDCIYVPGGDPGHTAPRYMLALLEKQTEVLKRYHPNAQMWMSPQGFDGDWMEEFLTILYRDNPEWLSGIVHGPQVRLSLEATRGVIPSRYPVRRYPDITHTIQAQYPVPDWDMAYALTEAREIINPRPRDQANIIRRQSRFADAGFITYSEGCNDDVNKTIWSGIGWDPESDVVEILRQYSRYYVGEEYTDTLAQAILNLESNWHGPLITNTGVYTTLQQVQELERNASPHAKLNWRFQQVLYRAYYDAYCRSRLIYESHLEEAAMEMLRNAPQMGSLSAMRNAEGILNRAVLERVSKDWRARIFELAEALYQSIRMQLSVDKYQALAIRRGANLDTIDVPLNNRLWLIAEFDKIRKLGDEATRLRRLESIERWTDPGPGGFYDDLGDYGRQPHLLRGVGSDRDPASFATPLIGFRHQDGWRTSWQRHAYVLYEQTLQMRYTGLDPNAEYQLRVVYGGDGYRFKIGCWADSQVVHGYIDKPTSPQVLEFDVPPSTTADGELILNWRQPPGGGSNGRGAQVAEVWLTRK